MIQDTKKKLIKSSFVIPFTQFDWGDYYADTDYLDFEEHGVYWNLLKRYYTRGPFENDMKTLQRVTKCPKNKLDAMQSILEEFFFILEEDGCWHHKRCDEEIMRVKGISEIQSQRARKGIAQKKRNSNGQFVSGEVLPSTAGLSPAIKEEDVTAKSNKEDKKITLRSIEEEEQELIKRLRIKYEDEYKNVIEDSRERMIASEMERDLNAWKIDKAKEYWTKKMGENQTH